MLTRRKFLKTGGLVTAGLAAGDLNSLHAESTAENAASEALAFVCQPYLQNLTPTEVTIMWITNNANCHGWVEYGVGRQIYLKAQEVTRGLVQANCRINRVKIKNLAPGATYSYRVCSQEITKFEAYSVTFGATITGDTYTFTTPGLNDTSVNALIFNDIHDKYDKYRRLINLSGMTDFDFVFLNGDILDLTPNEARILDKMIIPLSGLFASSKPFIAVRGNHETRDAYARNYFDYLEMGNDNKGYYTFTRGPVFFIALDSGEDKEDDHSVYAGLVDFDAYREEQAAWLDGVMQTDACRKALYRVVLMHIPPFESGWHGMVHCWQVFNPLFNRHKVDMVISGHTHQYGVHWANAQHAYPIIIGGGTGTSSTTSTGNATVIKLRANMQQLIVEIVDYNGQTVGLHTVVPAGATARSPVDADADKVFVRKDALCVETSHQDSVEIYNTAGTRLQSLHVNPGVTEIADLPANQLYIVKLGDKTHKVIY